MTRTLFVVAALLLVLMVALFVIGFAGQAPGAMMLGLLCGSPLFFLFLGAAVGRASNEFQLIHKARAAAPAQPVRTVNSRLRQPESLG